MKTREGVTEIKQTNSEILQKQTKNHEFQLEINEIVA